MQFDYKDLVLTLPITPEQLETKLREAWQRDEIAFRNYGTYEMFETSMRRFIDNAKPGRVYPIRGVNYVKGFAQMYDSYPGGQHFVYWPIEYLELVSKAI